MNGLLEHLQTEIADCAQRQWDSRRTAIFFKRPRRKQLEGQSHHSRLLTEEAILSGS